MNKEQEETLLQTIRARFERNEKGEAHIIPDPNGLWNIMPYSPTFKYPITRYFMPAFQPDLDVYGNINEGDQ